MMMVIEIAGWIGAVLLLASYALNINGKLGSTSVAYIMCNLLSGAFFAINTTYHRAYPSAVVNVIWFGIAVAALVKHKRKNKNNEKEQD